MLEHNAYTTWSVHITDHWSSAYTYMMHRTANAGDQGRKLVVVCPPFFPSLSVCGTVVLQENHPLHLSFAVWLTILQPFFFSLSLSCRFPTYPTAVCRRLNKRRRGRLAKQQLRKLCHETCPVLRGENTSNNG